MDWGAWHSKTHQHYSQKKFYTIAFLSYVTWNEFNETWNRLRWFTSKSGQFHRYFLAINRIAYFEKCKQLLECQKLLLLRDIWWLKLEYIFKLLLIFSTPVWIEHLWQLKTAVFLNRCLIRCVLLQPWQDKLSCICSSMRASLFNCRCKLHK